jgi:hypothetical protein
VNRGRSALPPAVPAERTLVADATDAFGLRRALQGTPWDVVVQWVGFGPEHVTDDLVTFAGAGQYIFISSASVYEKPPSSWLITERTPTVNPSGSTHSRRSPARACSHGPTQSPGSR